MMTYANYIFVEPMVRIGLTFLLYESSVLPLNYIGVSDLYHYFVCL